MRGRARGRRHPPVLGHRARHPARPALTGRSAVRALSTAAGATLRAARSRRAGGWPPRWHLRGRHRLEVEVEHRLQRRGIAQQAGTQRRAFPAVDQQVRELAHIGAACEVTALDRLLEATGDPRGDLLEALLDPAPEHGVDARQLLAEPAEQAAEVALVRARRARRGAWRPSRSCFALRATNVQCTRSSRRVPAARPLTLAARRFDSEGGNRATTTDSVPHGGRPRPTGGYASTIGSLRIGFLVSANRALATAGAIGGVPGSPMPPKASPLGTRWTWTRGISGMRRIR